MSLEDFLTSVNPAFGKYAEKLTENGLTSAEDLGIMQDEDFKYLGIPLFHWRQIVAKARELGSSTDTGAAAAAGETDMDPPTSAVAAVDPIPAYSPVSSVVSSPTSASTKRNPLNDWGTEEVALFVSTLGDGQYAEFAVNFEKGKIEGSVLLGITSVKDLAPYVPDLGARYAIYQGVEELQSGNVPEILSLIAKKEALSKSKSGARKDDAGTSGPKASEWGTSTSGDLTGKKAREERTAVSSAESGVRERLKKFYSIYNPEKLDQPDEIDELLRRYQGREKQLFEDLESKYIMSAKATTYKRQELARDFDDPTRRILEELSELYHTYCRHVEEAYEFPEFHTPVLDPVDFTAAPMVMLVGQYSVGKTTFIRFLIGRDFPGIRIGPEPTTDSFFSVMYGPDERLIPGHTVPMDRTKPFKTVQQFGAGFLNKFGCAEVPAPLLESITFIDTPGILSGEKQRLGRDYDFAKVVEWFAYRSDRILLLFDAHKLDISDEFKASIEMLKGHEDKIRCVLNKADAVTNQQLLRIYGALMWSLGKVFKTPEVVRVFVGSFWDEPYANEHNAELFDREADDLLSDLKGLPRHCSTRKINEFVKRTRQLRVHVLICEHLRSQFGMFGSKGKKQQKLLDNLRNEFKAVAKAENLHLNDFPNPDKFKTLIGKFDITKFPKLKSKWRQGLDTVLTENVPALIKKIPSSGRSKGDDSKEDMGGYNPFEESGLKDAALDASKKWAVSGTDKAKFDTTFYSLALRDGKASADQVKNVMKLSGLSREVLMKIWSLSDVDQDGAMDADEFALCMYLIEMVKSGLKLPPTLPIALIPPTKRHLVEYS